MKYPKLAALLGARAQIAKRSAATKRLNDKAVADGKPATHGGVGKARRRAAEKAALAAIPSEPQGSTTTPVTPPSQAQPAPAAVTSQPQGTATPVTPTSQAQPAAAVAPVNVTPHA